MDRLRHEYDKHLRALQSMEQNRRAAQAQADMTSAQISQMQDAIDARGSHAIDYAIANGSYPDANAPYAYVYELEKQASFVRANVRYLEQLLEQRL